MTPRGRGVAVLLAGAMLAGCIAVPRPSALACAHGDQARVRDTLYFGRNRPGGGSVEDAQWRDFLDAEVTPRFPDGLTVLDAQGQWRGANGRIERERAIVLVLLHAGDAAAQRAVGEIADAYRTRFGQEAVLRERVRACVRF